MAKTTRLLRKKMCQTELSTSSAGSTKQRSSLRRSCGIPVQHRQVSGRKKISPSSKHQSRLGQTIARPLSRIRLGSLAGDLIVIAKGISDPNTQACLIDSMVSILQQLVVASKIEAQELPLERWCCAPKGPLKPESRTIRSGEMDLGVVAGVHFYQGWKLENRTEKGRSTWCIDCTCDAGGRAIRS